MPSESSDIAASTSFSSSLPSAAISDEIDRTFSLGYAGGVPDRLRLERLTKQIQVGLAEPGDGDQQGERQAGHRRGQDALTAAGRDHREDQRGTGQLSAALRNHVGDTLDARPDRHTHRHVEEFDRGPVHGVTQRSVECLQQQRGHGSALQRHGQGCRTHGPRQHRGGADDAEPPHQTLGERQLHQHAGQIQRQGGAGEQRPEVLGVHRRCRHALEDVIDQRDHHRGDEQQAEDAPQVGMRADLTQAIGYGRNQPGWNRRVTLVSIAGSHQHGGCGEHKAAGEQQVSGFDDQRQAKRDDPPSQPPRYGTAADPTEHGLGLCGGERIGKKTPELDDDHAGEHRRPHVQRHQDPRRLPRGQHPEGDGDRGGSEQESLQQAGAVEAREH